jgi:GNAT superfamily N-acetyltransferase
MGRVCRPLPEIWQHFCVDRPLLRHALRVDIDVVVDVWVDAFVHDPYFRWIAPSDDVYVAFAHDWLSFIANLAFEQGHTYVDHTGQVATAWIPPDLSLVGPDDIDRARGIMAAHAGEQRAGQALATIVAARAHGMDEPHWTLQYIGARAASQGQGLGAAAVAPLLERCDADGLPCGLVSTNTRNVSFYERIGFVTVAEVPTPDHVAVLRPMHRPVSGR